MAAEGRLTDWISTIRRSRLGWRQPLTSWECWDDQWAVPTSGGITQSRQWLGYEPLKQFAQVAVPIDDELMRGGSWRLMAIDGFDWDIRQRHQCHEVRPWRSGENRSAFPRIE